MKFKHQMIKVFFSILIIYIFIGGTIKVNAVDDNTTEASNTTISDTNVSNTDSSNLTQNNTSQTESTKSNNTSKTESTKSNNTKSTKSNNANLKNLGIKPNDFKGFKAGTTSYDITVPSDVETVNVYAQAQDSKATITGTGNKNLTMGKNTLDVTVTAEDGTEKTYTLNITRGEETNTEEQNDTTNHYSSNLSELEIKGYTLNPEFSPDVYEYTLDINEDISELEVIAKGESEDTKIDIVGNTDLKDGENVITVLVYNEVTDENATYQVIVNKVNVNLEDLDKMENEAIAKANRIRLILIILGICIVIAIIIFIILHKIKMKNNIDDDDIDYDEDDPESFQQHLFKKVDKAEFESSEKEKKLNSNKINLEEDQYEDENIIEETRQKRTKRKGKHF